MSSSVYTYESSNLPDPGTFQYAVRANPVLFLAVNPGAAISLNPLMMFELSTSKRAKGPRPRNVSIVRKNPSTGNYLGPIVKVAVATQETWDGITSGTEYTIAGQEYVAVNKEAEETL